MLTANHRVVDANFESTIRTTIWTGRPLRAAVTPYIRDWEVNRQDEIRALRAKGIVPLDHELEGLRKAGGIPQDVEEQSTMR